VKNLTVQKDMVCMSKAEYDRLCASMDRQQRVFDAACAWFDATEVDGNIEETNKRLASMVTAARLTNA
jgi:hypothetical protein